MNNSVTVDEYAHLPAGAAYWKYREFSIYDLSPPLLRLWAAAPVMLAGADAPPALPLRDLSPSSRHWEYAQLFMDSNRARYRQLFLIARLWMIPLSCLAAWIVFVWARSLYGALGGLLACALYCLDPNFLAHGSLVSTDTGTAAAVVLAGWLWWRFCRLPTPARLLAASVAVSAAILCKFSALLLGPALLLVAAEFTIFRRHSAGRIAMGLLISALVGLVLINLVYGYHRTFQPLRKFHFESKSMQRLSAHLPGWMPVPLPDFFLEGLDTQMLESGPRVPAFALGQSYVGSRWYYYPLALGCKLPLSTLAILGMTAASFAIRRGRLHESVPAILLLVVGVGTVVLADMNIGIRHILPAMPLAYVLCGRLCARRTPRILPPILGASIVILAIEVIPTGPNYISFFNHAVGGPARGQLILNDSNFDWGQGLISLHRWMDANHVDRIGLAYFGRVDPGIYGVRYEPMTQAVDTQFVAISSYFRVGMPYRLRVGKDQFSDWVELRNASRLRKLKPVAIVDRVMYIYRRSDLEQAVGPGAMLEPLARPIR